MTTNDTRKLNKEELRSEIAFLEQQLVYAGEQAKESAAKKRALHSQMIAAGYIPIELLSEPKIVHGRYGTEAQIKSTDQRVINALSSAIARAGNLPGLLGKVQAGRVHPGGYTGGYTGGILSNHLLASGLIKPRDI